MFRYNSGAIRLISPVICLILLIAPLQDLLAAEGAVANQSQNDQTQTGSSTTYGPKRISDPSAIIMNESQEIESQGDSEPAPAGSFGSGKLATDLQLGSQNVTAHESQNGEKSHSPVVSKSGYIDTGQKNNEEQGVEFENPFQSSILVLTLEWHETVGGLPKDLAFSLISSDGTVSFQMVDGLVEAPNLASITVRDLDSIATLDYRSLSDSLSQYDQFLIIDEDSRRLFFVNPNSAEGVWHLSAVNSGSDEFSYRIASIPIATGSTSDGCDVCHTVMGAAAYLASELACSASPWLAPVIICALSIEIWALIPLCVSSALFVASWGDILGLIICQLSEGPRRTAEESLTSWFCTVTGACTDTYPPLVYLHSPSNGDQYSGIFNVTATVAGDASPIDYVEFDYSTNGGATWADVVGPGHSDGTVVFEGEGSILFDTEEAGIVFSNSMKVRVKAADTEGNTSDWVESEGVFVVDNRDPDITTIAVILNLTPNPVSPYSAVDAYGTAQYNTGSPVTNGTVTISHSADSWTAWLDENGSFSRTITAPPSSELVTSSVTDGNLTGQDQEYLTVTSDGSGDGFTFYRSTMCRDADNDYPYDPIGETHCFRTDDDNVYSWVHLTNLYVPVQVRWYWYLPDGSQFQNPLTSDCTDDPQDYGYEYWDWWKLYYGWSIAGYSLADYEGRHSIKIYAKECGEGYEYMESQYWVLAYDLSHHLMCKDVGPYPSEPVDSTNTFVTTDGKAMTWAKFVDVSESIEVKWEYYEPSGALYDSFEHTTDDPDPGSCWDWTKAWGWIWIDGYAAASKCGRWTVKVYEKDVWGNWDELYTDHFIIEEAVNQNPSVSVTLNSDPPLEGQNLSVTISGSDNCSIEAAVLYWDVGAENSTEWQAIHEPSFSQQAYIGSFPANQSVEVYARMIDLSGNLGESQHLFITVVDTDTEGPEISSATVNENAGNGNGRLEDCEQLHISFSASDPSGVDSIALIIDSTEVVLQGTYYSVVDPLQAGPHTITIFAMDGDDPPAANVLIDTFWIDPMPDAPNEIVSPTEDDTVSAESVNFTWRSVPTADSGYVFEADSSTEFNSAQLWSDTLRSVEDTSLSGSLMVGTRYYWRLASRSYCGLSSFSAPRSFVTSCPTLIGPNPTTLRPEDGSAGGTEVTFEWGEVIGAWAYALRIDTLYPGTQYQWRCDTVLDPSSTINIPEMTIYWQVQALGTSPCSDGQWTSPAQYLDVEEIPTSTLPQTYALNQNYPNPFNPETRIGFALPRASFVTLDVFNILGKRIRVLVSQRLSAGHKVIVWDGKNDNGSEVSSGMYLYRITAGEFVETKKMVLLK